MPTDRAHEFDERLAALVAEFGDVVLDDEGSPVVAGYVLILEVLDLASDDPEPSLSLIRNEGMPRVHARGLMLDGCDRMRPPARWSVTNHDD